MNNNLLYSYSRPYVTVNNSSDINNDNSNNNNSVIIITNSC